MHLGLGYLLQGGKYEIVRYISSGGFGCTYEARHTLFKKTVAIKEFFVKDFCNRNEQGYVEVATQGKVELVNKLRAKFIDEATALYELQHPNIVRVTDVFEENGTAYYVMEYIDGLSLADLISQKGALAESEALGYICQVADALSYVHSKNRLHLDVKPQNIMIDRNGKAVLIDFGVSKQYDEANGENTSTLLGCTPGYAPIEQVGNNVVDFRPATDIYALGATLYKALSGVTPLAANLLACGDELAPLPSSVSRATRKAVEVAMDLNRHKRPQSIAKLMDILAISPRPFSREVSSGEKLKVDDDATVLKDAGGQQGHGKTPFAAETDITHKPVNSRKSNKSIPFYAIILLLILVVTAVMLFVGNTGSYEHRSVVKEPRLKELKSEQKTEDEPEYKPEYKTEPEFADRVFSVNGVEFTMVAVEGDEFEMGSNSGEENERPVHVVKLSDYYIGETEVTQELWEAVMGYNPSKFEGYPQRPVENINYNDCNEFIAKLNELTGENFKLPTEAQWEYAARGGKYSKEYRYSGSNEIDGVAWYDKDNKDTGSTHVVKRKSPNELGLYDMSGNVWEWCFDCYAEYKSSEQVDPKIDNGSGSERVIRGGSWGRSATRCRTTYRGHAFVGISNFNYGLRLAL